MKLNPQIRESVFEKANYKCYNCNNRGTEAHHVIAKTKTNIKIYGIENIDSESNLVCVCHQCHDKHSTWDKKLRRNLKNKFEKITKWESTTG